VAAAAEAPRVYTPTPAPPVPPTPPARQYIWQNVRARRRRRTRGPEWVGAKVFDT